MPKKKFKVRRGLTIVELMIATALAGIIISGVAIVLGDAQRGWNAMYNRVYSDVVTDGYIARRTFDSIVRNATGEDFSLDAGGNWLEVYYYADANSTVLDRYARFYEAYGQLNVEYGILEPRETLRIQTVCGNVQGCVFRGAGKSAQMILTLSDGSQTTTVMSSAVMHN